MVPPAVGMGILPKTPSRHLTLWMVPSLMLIVPHVQAYGEARSTNEVRLTQMKTKKIQWLQDYVMASQMETSY